MSINARRDTSFLDQVLKSLLCSVIHDLLLHRRVFHHQPHDRTNSRYFLD